LLAGSYGLGAHSGYTEEISAVTRDGDDDLRRTTH